MRLVNIGCGAHYHGDWINIDLVAHDPTVIGCDIRRGIPLKTGSCDVVYHSCILEHLSPDEGIALLRECKRILKPGGVIRVAVPDLEQICTVYLDKLEGARRDIPRAESDYDWMMLEMYDQTVREKSGGRMAEYLAQNPIPNHDFVLARIGEEARSIMRSLSERETQSQRLDPEKTLARRLRRRISRPQESMEIALHLFKKLCIKALEQALGVLTGEDFARQLRDGRFKSGGEIHKWMYDRFSLGRALKRAGFERPTVVSAFESVIPRWTSYHLDALEDGSVRKPDSLFMEAINPASID